MSKPSKDQEALILKIIGQMSRAYKFDIYDHDDIKSEMYIIALSGFEKYRPEMGKLEHFLRVHIRNRILDLRRNKFGSGKTDASSERLKVLQPVHIGIVPESVFAFTEDMENSDLCHLIDRKLSAGLREYYLKLLEGLKISSARKKRVIDAIKMIVESQNG